MAAPSSITLQNLNGKWKLNKDLSGDYTKVLSIQGVSAITRTLVSPASVHLTTSQPSKDHIKMEQNATAAKLPGTTEDYQLDWEWRDSKDAFFGEIQGRSRWISVEDAKGEGIGSGGWIEGDSEGMLVQAEGKKPDGEWEAAHLWGFEHLGGERRHTRQTKVKNNKGEELQVKMVYDFEGE